MPGPTFVLDGGAPRRSVKTSTSPTVVYTPGLGVSAYSSSIPTSVQTYNTYGKIQGQSPTVTAAVSSSTAALKGANAAVASATNSAANALGLNKPNTFFSDNANTSVLPGTQGYSVGSKPTLGFSDEKRLIRDKNKLGGPPLPPGNPNEYDWNLPPHQWSLPTQPAVVNEAHYTANKLKPKKQVSDKYRRGRLWWKANPPISTVDGNGNVSTIGRGEEYRKFGFQFLWNPETFGTQVAVQLEATPSVQDRFLGVSGAFPATETVSFTLRLDRTNDFACASALLPQLEDVGRSAGVASDVIKQADVQQFMKYYLATDGFARGNNLYQLGVKLVDLYQRGTLADLEYLYKAINGPGPGGGGNARWLNGRGIKTADIGWLMPTLLHVDVGPLSYDGYVTAMQVTHLAFTPSMVPIRSDLTVSLNILATSSLTTATQQ